MVTRTSSSAKHYRVIAVDTRAQGKSIQRQVMELGMPRFTQWANQPKQSMINVVREMLINASKGKHPGLYVMRRCVNTIMEFQSWAYRRKSDGTIADEGGDSAYQDESNHILDGIVGMLSTGKITF